MLNIDDMYFVYLLVCGDFYKIGMTKDISKRISSLRSSCPYPIELDDYMMFDNYHEARSAEKYLHKKLAKYNVHGEWFQNNPEVWMEFDYWSCVDDEIWQWYRSEEFEIPYYEFASKKTRGIKYYNKMMKERGEELKERQREEIGDKNEYLITSQ